jgi:ABC-type multidrug transport system, permease component
MKFAALADRNFKEIIRDPLSTGLGIAMPGAMILVFSSLSKTVPNEIFTAKALTPGLAVFSFAFLIMFSSMLLSKDRSSGLFARLRATPLDSADFALAYSLPYLPFALLQALACFAIGAILGAPMSWGTVLSLLALLPAAAACLGIGLALGALFSENQIAGLGSALVTVFGVIGGAWFDLRMAGGLFEKIGYALPFAHAVDAARALCAGASIATVGVDLAWVWAWAIALLGAGLACVHAKTKP